jgi:hypothetical protein
MSTVSGVIAPETVDISGLKWSGGEGFGFAEGAEEVAAGQGGAVGLGPAAVQELGEQGRVAGHVGQAGRDVAGAVEVAAETPAAERRRSACEAP